MKAKRLCCTMAVVMWLAATSCSANTNTYIDGSGCYQNPFANLSSSYCGTIVDFFAQ